MDNGNQDELKTNVEEENPVQRRRRPLRHSDPLELADADPVKDEKEKKQSEQSELSSEEAQQPDSVQSVPRRNAIRLRGTQAQLQPELNEAAEEGPRLDKEQVSFEPGESAAEPAKKALADGSASPKKKIKIGWIIAASILVIGIVVSFAFQISNNSSANHSSKFIGEWKLVSMSSMGLTFDSQLLRELGMGDSIGMVLSSNGEASISSDIYEQSHEQFYWQDNENGVFLHDDTGVNLQLNLNGSQELVLSFTSDGIDCKVVFAKK